MPWAGGGFRSLPPAGCRCTRDLGCHVGNVHPGDGLAKGVHHRGPPGSRQRTRYPSRGRGRQPAGRRTARRTACPVTTASPVPPLCRLSNFHPRFCTHTAHDDPPVRSDSLGGVISAIVRGGAVAPALRPVRTEHLRGRAAAAGPRGRDGVVGALMTPLTPSSATRQRAASHLSGVSRMADIPPLISPCGIASEQTGDPGPWRRAAGGETVLPSTSRNGARQESEDNADQAGRSKGRAARKGCTGS